MTPSAAAVKARALELGFNLVGITPARPSPFLSAYERWLEAGMHAEMGYMARPDRVERRRDLQVILPGARSLVVVGLDYGQAALPEAIRQDPLRGRIATYAWGLDYHEVMTPRLEQLAAWLNLPPHPLARLQEERGSRSRVYVDTGPLLERGHAQAAGMGFIGKNTMLIHPRRGSTFFLGEILTPLEFDHYDQPQAQTMCGRCTRCLTACPTDAFPAPHVLDARRCISYLTIEHKGSIDLALRPLMGNWVYGCDICQDVCPFQRFASPTAEPTFQTADLDRVAPRLVDLLALDEDRFQAQYDKSAIERIKRERLVRNACVAAGNSRSPELLPALQRLTQDTSDIVREHAIWAIGQIEAAQHTK
ncbi:MAG TPA: tRNA epoxyqueuosine(34) reductase QueG [Aggregatilineales bacterium]|nr:tRNA epoxyqueuosine(34) reductase QueG [Aggregatilineales bacterium]